MSCNSVCQYLIFLCLFPLAHHPTDTLLELSLHKVALKPVSSQLYSCIHASRTEDGSFRRLQSNMRVLEKKGLEELGGSSGVGVPDSVTLERIQQRWASVHEAYSPNKKVRILLKVCKSIYHSMSANATSGTFLLWLCVDSDLCCVLFIPAFSLPADNVFGADDFLPCLTWVLLRCDVVALQIDTDYMMELLDPTQLQGEGKADAFKHTVAGRMIDLVADFLFCSA